jgi:hypothetical protein
LRKKVIGTIIAGAIAAIVIGSLVWAIILSGNSNGKLDETNPFEGWNISGPFAINKFEYKVDEHVFMSVNGLQENETGKIVVITPKDKEWFSIPFDGGKKSDFNQYFKPNLIAPIGFCTVDDLVGDWKLVFEGTSYESIHFKIINETVPGSEKYYKENVCEKRSSVLPSGTSG